jgi:hypothetical protein
VPTAHDRAIVHKANWSENGFWHSNTAEDMAMCAVVGTCCALYAARVTIPRGHYAEATTRYTQSWDLLLRKGGERKAEWRME